MYAPSFYDPAGTTERSSGSRKRRLSIALLLATLATLPATGKAQDAGTWLVLPVTTNELTAAEERLAEAAEGQLAERQHTTATPSTSDFGSNARELSPDLQRRLSEAVEPTLEHAAFGRRSRVIESVVPLLDEAARSLDALGRAPLAVRNVSDLALITARAHLDGRDEASARAAVERLLSLVPNPEPTVDSHPHAVLALLSRAQTRLREMAGDGRLRVTSLDPGGCNVYLNGQLTGPAPQELSLYAGDYAVRMQCGRTRGRVHLAHVESGETVIEISAALEAVFRPSPRPHLRYDDTTAMVDRAARDTATLMRHLGAEQAILIRIEGASTRLEAVHVTDADAQVDHTAHLTTPAQRAELEAAWRMLFDGVGLGDEETSSGASDWNAIIGVALIVVGIAALVSPAYTLARLDQCIDPSPCATVVGFGPINATFTAVGLAAIAGGGVFWGLSPIRTSVTPDGSASLSLEGTF